MSGPGTPAGWYEDRDHPGQWRYWDGETWTEHTAPASESPPEPPSSNDPPADPDDTSHD